MNRVPTRPCLLVFAVLVLSAPAVGAQQAPPVSAEPAEPIPADVLAGLEVPRPDLTALAPAAQEKIAAVQTVLDRLLAAERPPRRDVAQGFSFLGQLLHAFNLLQAAETAYGHAIALLPDDPRWIYYRGLVRHSRGELEAAAEDYARVAELGPGTAAVHVRRGDALLALGRLEAAEASFRSALGTEGGEAAARFGLGRVASARGDAETAVEQLEAALALQPDASAVHYPLAQAYRRLGDEERARSHLEQRGPVPVRYPDELAQTVTRIAKTVAYEVIRDLAAAEEGFAETDFLGFVLSQFGDNPETAYASLTTVLQQLEAGGEPPAFQRGRLHYALAGLAVAAGRDDDAIGHLEQAVELAPGLVDARLKLGNALARRGDFEAALAQYDEVLARQPDDAEALEKRGSARANLGRLEAARRDFERALEVAPRRGDVRIKLATVLERLGEAEAAEAAREEALEGAAGGGDRAAVLMSLATDARRRGELEEALAYYRRVLEADPQHSAALNGLASLYGQVGEYDRAVEVYRRLIEKEPENRVARMGEVTALLLAGRDREARERLEAGLRVLPGDLSLKDVLARLLAAADDRSVRDGGRALELAREVYENVPTAQSLETLAMAHAQAGDHAEAARLQRQLLERLEAEAAEAGEELDAATEERLRANLALYEAGEVCCATGSSNDENSSAQSP